LRWSRVAKLAAAAAVLLLHSGSSCGEWWHPLPPTSTPPPVVPPQLSITLNGVPDAMNDLLVVPPSGFVVNLAIAPGTHPTDASRLELYAMQWDGGFRRVPWSAPAPDAEASAGVFPDLGLDAGTCTLIALAPDVEGNWGQAEISFAIRNFPAGQAPIRSGQQIWLDFASDRDAVPGEDFAVDLLSFGLGSPSTPALSAEAERRVVEAVLDRVAQVYHQEDGNGLGAPDPVQVDFFADDPGPGDVTRICVGGEDPSGGATIGNAPFDPNNAVRTVELCGTIPPTGIFPRELLYFLGEASFQAVFAPLLPALGGTPVGEGPLDGLVLAPPPVFVPAPLRPAVLARTLEIETAITAFGDALGTIIAHETGHALGLVAAGPPGGGLYGGTAGAASTHDVLPGGATPTENLVMNAGTTYSFAKLAGLEGQSLAVIRALDFAYLRDRVVLDPKVTGLYLPPQAVSVSPSTLASNLNTKISVLGGAFRATPSMRIESGAFVAQLQGELFVSASEVRGWVLGTQALPGLYDLVVENPDGQTMRLPQAITLVAP
jgi:hypothetical protein